MIPSAQEFLSGNLSPLQEQRFFASLKLSNGTSKTTADHRMDDLNAFVCERFRATGFDPKSVMDVGASSGISSLEFLEALERTGHAPQMTATDISVHAKISRISSWLNILKEPNGNILQYIACGIPIRPWRRRADNFTGYRLLTQLMRTLTRNSTIVGETPIKLVSHRVLKKDKLIFEQDNILDASQNRFDRQFDVIRAANILNLGYFDSQTLSLALSNLHRRMRDEKSLLIVNRTLRDGTNNATVFSISKNGAFNVDSRFGNGSEIEKIVLECKLVDSRST